MFRGGKWHLTDSARGGTESFYPCTHLRSHRWKYVRYPAKPDYKFLRPKKRHRARFQPRSLSHVTTFKGAKRIFSSGTFSCRSPKNIGVDTSFSWWSFEIAEGQKKREREKYQKNIKAKALLSVKIHEFFNSPPFEVGSRYGNFKFTYKMKSLFEMYKNSVCGGRRVEFRVLGTFTYKLEVMHAVVVCPSDVPLFKKCPPVGKGTQAVVSKSGQGWTWRPDSTRYNFCCWDHVSFAFYLPRDGPAFTIPPGYPQFTCCKVVGKLLRRYNITPEDKFDECLEILDGIWKKRVAELKIHYPRS